jgi:hypothetical protein
MQVNKINFSFFYLLDNKFILYKDSITNCIGFIRNLLTINVNFKHFSPDLLIY